MPIVTTAFIMDIEGLSRMTNKDKHEKKLRGVKVLVVHYITHLLCVVYVIVLWIGSEDEWHTFHEIIKIFCNVFGMEVSLPNIYFYTVMLRMKL